MQLNLQDRQANIIFCCYQEGGFNLYLKILFKYHIYLNSIYNNPSFSFGECLAEIRAQLAQNVLLTNSPTYAAYAKLSALTYCGISNKDELTDFSLQHADLFLTCKIDFLL